MIGLISPVGMNKKQAIEILTEVLGGINCETRIIKLTNLLKNIPRYAALTSIPEGQEEKRIKAFMDAGDHIRRVANPAALVLLGAGEIFKQREKEKDKRVVYIIDSLKHPVEIKVLKHIYSERFLPIAFYSDREIRLNNLMKKIAGAHFVENEKHFRLVAEKLIDRDEDGGSSIGQNLREAFPLADIFINSDVNPKPPIERSIKAWFGNSFITPTKEEVGMFMASAVSLRSSDLSRQVGAVIINNEGSIVSTGCNETPSSLGGVTWDGDPIDTRDFIDGYDTNHRFKQSSIGEIVEALIKHQWLRKDLKSSKKEDLVQKIQKDKVFKGTRLTNLIEFGKIVHAEMAAITEAARNGLPLAGTTLLCTTFPCHMCARHIIASGIKKVVYIEPYPKSLTTHLYSKIITSRPGSKGILFVPFEGIGPNRYKDFFTMGQRKNESGEKIDWNPKTSNLKGLTIFNVTDLIEKTIELILKEHATSFGLGTGKKDPHPWKLEVEK